jgi:DNA-directed RNA polymerase subunit RPC12/RpoP
MTIKIIKRGQIPDEAEHNFKCSHCSTEFTAQGKDCEKMHNKSFMINCPVCEHVVCSINSGGNGRLFGDY